MATFSAVIAIVKDEAAFYEKAKPLGVTRLREAKGAIAIDTARPEELATSLSALAGVERAFALYGQSSVDGYVVAENVGGEVVRRLVYNRDYGGWETRGEGRPWETDFQFGQSLERFESKLDEEWSDEDVARAKSAYEARDVAALEALPSVPRATYDQLTTFAEHLGFDFEGGPHAKHRRRGWLARLFG